MKFYCGIDLSARDCQVCVIDEQLQVMVQQKLRNDLTKSLPTAQALPSQPEDRSREHLQLVLADRWFAG